MNDFKDITVAVASTGYVCLSIATLLSQHHHVTAVDVIPEKVEKLNNKISPIQDDYIEKYLAEKPLNLVATLDSKSVYKNADNARQSSNLGRMKLSKHRAMPSSPTATMLVWMM